jgi:hypothetical protein
MGCSRHSGEMHFQSFFLHAGAEIAALLPYGYRLWSWNGVSGLEHRAADLHGVGEVTEPFHIVPP